VVVRSIIKNMQGKFTFYEEIKESGYTSQFNYWVKISDISECLFSQKLMDVIGVPFVGFGIKLI